MSPNAARCSYVGTNQHGEPWTITPESVCHFGLARAHLTLGQQPERPVPSEKEAAPVSSPILTPKDRPGGWLVGILVLLSS